MGEGEVGLMKIRSQEKTVAPKAPKLDLKVALPLFDKIPVPEDKKVPPLQEAQYRLGNRVNTRNASVEKIITSIMREIGASEANIFLYSKREKKLEHYRSIRLNGNGYESARDGPRPDEITCQAFDLELNTLAIPKGDGATSMLHVFNRVPDDPRYVSMEIENGGRYHCSALLYMCEDEEQGMEDPVEKLGMLVLKGKPDKVLESSLGREETFVDVMKFIATGARNIASMVDGKFDPVTGLLTRREFEVQLRAMIKDYLGGGPNFSLLMLDLDRFKRINDRFGHDFGDEALFAAAKAISNSVRIVRGGEQFDLVGRWGGEEFTVMVPGADSRKGVEIAERIRKNLLNSTIMSPLGRRLWLTTSIGVVDAKTVFGRDEIHFSPEHSIREMTKPADHALYEVKKLGRNQVARAIKEGDDFRFEINGSKMSRIAKILLQVYESFAVIGRSIKL